MIELRKIYKFVNEKLNLDIGTNLSNRMFTDGRAVYYIIAKRKFPRYSDKTIGSLFGKNRATVINGMKTYCTNLENNPTYSDIFKEYTDPNFLKYKKEERTYKQDCIILNKINRDLLRQVDELKKKIILPKGYYNLTDSEKKILNERLELIIKMMPSNQKRKEVFEIINCSA